MDTISKIGNKDVLWSLVANFLRIGYGIILFPLILHKLPSETVAFWTIFTSISSLIYLFDFGFSSSFSRNVSYVFSGVQSLKKHGFNDDVIEGSVNYSLLKGLINAMRWFYGRIALLVFILLVVFGTIYINILLKEYSGNATEIYIAWGILCVVCTFNIYTLYYDALLQGKGHVKECKQYSIIGSTINIIVATIFILMGQGLVSITLAQFSSVFTIRFLSRRKFFSSEIKKHLNEQETSPVRDVLKSVSPNAIKVGLTSLGSFAILKSSLFVGSLYLPLTTIASYGITMQIITLIDSIARSYYLSYTPKVCRLRVERKNKETMMLYIRSAVFAFFVFVIAGVTLVFCGDWVLNLIKSKTILLPNGMLAAACTIAWLECNHSIAGGFLLANNEVPYFKAALISGGFTILLLILLFTFVGEWGAWIMILAPGIVQLVYQNWRWPYVLVRDLRK